jgi:glycerophosphoryl diester phosphodiesterase
MIAPKNKKEMKKFTRIKYAHRGLHNEERAENSMSAFLAAAEAGYGIELDVHLSKDGKLVVFHDNTLDRVCGVRGRVADFTAKELSRLSLNGTGEGIPLFSDVLAAIDGRVPLLVEIKEETVNTDVAAAVCNMLKNYKGEYIIESFNPFSLRTVRKRMPKVNRGILSTKYFTLKKPGSIKFLLLQLLMTNFLFRPAFVAYDHKYPNAISLKVIRAVFGVPTLAWTVRSREEEVLAYNHGFDAIIFENYLPKP